MAMELDPALLEVLVCPLTRGPLLYVPASASEPPCLLSIEGRRRYPIEAGLPVLLVAESTVLPPSELDRLRRRATSAAPTAPEV